MRYIPCVHRNRVQKVSALELEMASLLPDFVEAEALEGGNESSGPNSTELAHGLIMQEPLSLSSQFPSLLVNSCQATACTRKSTLRGNISTRPWGGFVRGSSSDGTGRMYGELLSKQASR